MKENSSTIITDDEKLYRCIFYQGGGYSIENNKVSSQAFNDRYLAPSVDRASLCHFPSYTQKCNKDGVVSLLSKKVRSIDSVQKRGSSGALELIYKVDIIHRPLEDNSAHAQIEPDPEYHNKTVFRKLKEALAVLVNEDSDSSWEIFPADCNNVH